MAVNNANEELSLEEYNEELSFDQKAEFLIQQENLLSQQLEEAFAELELSEEERKKIGNPEALGDVIKDEVWNKLVSQFGFELTEETLIQEYDKEHSKETYEEVGKKVMQDPNYKKANKEMKDKQQAGALKDEYTGKNISQNDSANLDHTVSRKEIFENQRRKQANLSTEKLANKKENLNATNEALNKSKGAKSVDEYLENREQRESDLIKQNEKKKQKIDASNGSDAEKQAAKEKADKRLQDKLDADDEKMKNADEKARKAINKDINKGAAKEIGKKAAGDAVKVVIASALMDMLKATVNGLIRFIKSSAKSFKSFLAEMKESLKSCLSKVLNYLSAGTSALLGTIVSEIFGPIVSMFKKLASMIKQGISSFIEAINFFLNPENKNMPFSIKAANVGKIIVSGLSGMGALLLGEVIEKGLMSFPVMAFQIPLLEISLAGILGTFLSSLVTGLIGAIILNMIDKFIAKKLKEESNTAIIEKKNEILFIQEKQIDVNQAIIANTRDKAAESIMNRHYQSNQQESQILEEIFNDRDRERADRIATVSNKEALEAIQKSLEELL